MPSHDLTATLRELVHRHGISSVLHSLADIQSVQDAPKAPSSPKRSRNDRSKLSAVGYVASMTLPPGKAEVMKRAAECFEEKTFIPTIADVREFCRIHGVTLGKTASRINSVPRVFTYLAAMDTARIARILDEGMFSGPTRLAPIADTIRGHSGSKGRTEPSTAHAAKLS